MKLEFAYTREDWTDCIRFFAMRIDATGRNLGIILFSVVVIPAMLLFALSSSDLWGVRVPLALVGVALVAALTLWLARRYRMVGAPPQSWTSTRVCEFRDDGILTTTSFGEYLYVWRAVREIVETDRHIFLVVDNTYGHMLPKRVLEPVGGPAVVRSELERRMYRAS